MMLWGLSLLSYAWAGWDAARNRSGAVPFWLCLFLSPLCLVWALQDRPEGYEAYKKLVRLSVSVALPAGIWLLSRTESMSRLRAWLDALAQLGMAILWGMVAAAKGGFPRGGRPAADRSIRPFDATIWSKSGIARRKKMGGIYRCRRSVRYCGGLLGRRGGGRRDSHVAGRHADRYGAGRFFFHGRNPDCPPDDGGSSAGNLCSGAALCCACLCCDAGYAFFYAVYSACLHSAYGGWKNATLAGRCAAGIHRALCNRPAMAGSLTAQWGKFLTKKRENCLQDRRRIV